MGVSFRVLYIRVPYFRKLPYVRAQYHSLFVLIFVSIITRSRIPCFVVLGGSLLPHL